MRCHFRLTYFAIVAFVTVKSLPAQTVANYVSMTPCRVIETRDSTYGAFGTPFLAAKSSRDFPIPTSSCNVPAGAVAYSFNVTVIPHGPLAYITMWPTGQPQPGASTLNSPNGAVLANAAIIAAGTNGSVSVYAAADTELIVDINGYFVSQTAVLNQLNQQILQLNTQVAQLNQQIAQQGTQTNTQIAQLNQQIAQQGTQTNTQIAQLSQQVSPLATQIGQVAQVATQVNQQAAQVSQQFNQFSQQITQINAVLTDVHSDASKQGVALGSGTSTSGTQNTSVGYQSFKANNSGSANAAIGASALVANNSGSYNVAVGVGALSGLVTGQSNIAVGFNAGSNSGDTSNSIEIGSQGQAGDNNVIRIGDPNVHQNTYVAGITNAYVDVGSYVLVDQNGKLGTSVSSIRYKEQVENIDDVNDALLALRPVRFRYKQPNQHGEKPIQYGLIAEEVEKIMPELVIHNPQGEVEGIQYHQLPALLLNELQKQHRLIEQQQKQIKAEQQNRRCLQARLVALESQAKSHHGLSSHHSF